MEFNGLDRRSRRIVQDISRLKNNIEHQWDVQPYDSNRLDEWKFYLTGPSNTPYENGRFEVRIVFPVTYPFHQPNLYFVTPIFHPNIAMHAGTVSMEYDYTLFTGLQPFFKNLILTLHQPSSAGFLNDGAAFLFSHNMTYFKEEARRYTLQYALEALDNQSISSPSSTLSLSTIVSTSL